MNPVSKFFYVGVFLIALSTLLLEILLTRIFSVVMWYHFAFLAISIAMFGLTVGAMIVYLVPRWFPDGKVVERTAQSAFFFSISTIGSLLIYIGIPASVPFRSSTLLFLTITYVLFSIPFIFSGMSICLALTKFPRHVHSLYASDLIGAGIGCFAVIGLLSYTDGATAVIIAAFLGMVSSLFFIASTASCWKKPLFLLVVLLGLGSLLLVVFAHDERPLIRFDTYKGNTFNGSGFERWNTYAHIYAEGSLTEKVEPFMWCGRVRPSTPDIPHIKLMIEGYGYTTITQFRNLDSLRYLKNDVINLAHYLKSDADVLIIGSGGGRDVLSALVFNQSSITGVELNRDILEALTDRYAAFAGNLDEHPKVTLIESEGRSFLASSSVKYDLIQLINVHTWAATTAGAYTLTENSLYTLEAWDLLLDHLADEGIITLSMWIVRDHAGEVYRMVALASEALRRKGMERPLDHIMVSNCDLSGRGLAAMVVSKDAFSLKDINTFTRVSENLKFSVGLSPKRDQNMLGDIVRGNFSAPIAWEYPLNIEPPTDDNPYFFNLLSLKDIFKWKPWIDSHVKYRRFLDFNLEAVFVLVLLLGIVFVLAAICVLLPLLVRRGRRPSFSEILFFGSIGLGFMLIEIAQIQRLVLFLGHPTYSLSVVLFSLLVAGGVGSFVARNVSRPLPIFLGLLGVIVAVGLATPLLGTFIGSGLHLKIALAFVVMSVLGVFMGMAFPLGIRLLEDSDNLPWFWGINGAASITGSILAIIIAMTYGISKAYWTGFGCYMIAVVSFNLMRKR